MKRIILAALAAISLGQAADAMTADELAACYHNVRIELYQDMFGLERLEAVQLYASIDDGALMEREQESAWSTQRNVHLIDSGEHLLSDFLFPLPPNDSTYYQLNVDMNNCTLNFISAYLFPESNQ